MKTHIVLLSIILLGAVIVGACKPSIPPHNHFAYPLCVFPANEDWRPIPEKLEEAITPLDTADKKSISKAIGPRFLQIRYCFREDSELFLGSRFNIYASFDANGRNTSIRTTGNCTNDVCNCIDRVIGKTALLPAAHSYSFRLELVLTLAQEECTGYWIRRSYENAIH